MICRVALRMCESGKVYVGEENDRHDALYRMYGEDVFVGPHEQGFVDENEKFYNRKEAAKHAFEWNQVEKEYEILMSEDVW